MKKFKTFLFVSVFLLNGCSSFNGVDYGKVESLNVEIRDIEGKILDCEYKKGYSVNCKKKEIENENEN